MKRPRVKIIGGGLAGVEAAFQVARAGYNVDLYEMRPIKQTPAHKTPYLAEIVCSNSFGSVKETSASGLLKKEMELLDSIVLNVAREVAVPAGQALAVDREEFGRRITRLVEENEKINVIREEVTEIPDEGPVIIATGPLTSEALSSAIIRFTGRKNLYFFDATTPIVTASSIDMSKAFVASRYGKGGADYINCPMTEEEYQRFYEALLKAERVELKEFEKKLFEACLPIEEIAARGPKTLIFGPLKPVGLKDPKTGKTPFAIVQLRQDNIAGTLYSLVGFQTRLKWGEQKRVFSLIPCLRNAEFVRYGVMHRNTYINSPAILLESLQTRKRPDLLFAGQIIGVEGYMESAAMGIMAGIFAVKLIRGEKIEVPPRTTAIGSLLFYIANADWRNFQPMNFVFGILPPLSRRIKDKKERRLEYYKRAISHMQEWIKKNLSKES